MVNMKGFFIKIIFETHQIQISCFSRHFYEVNLILVLALIHWTNFDGTKILFIFYDSTFKAMTFSMCPEADQNISNRLIHSMYYIPCPK